MEGATHFIEVWNVKPERISHTSNTKAGSPLPLSYLLSSLNSTEDSRALRTVAIFFIKLKNK